MQKPIPDEGEPQQSRSPLKVMPATYTVEGSRATEQSTQEQLSLQQDIAQLTLESERGTNPIAFVDDVLPAETRQGGHDSGRRHSSSLVREKVEDTPYAVQDALSPKLRPPLHIHRRLIVSSDNVRHIKVEGQSLTASSLADAVEGAADATAEGEDDRAADLAHRRPQNSSSSSWSLAIHGCHLPSLLPVAALLDHLKFLCTLEIDGCAGISLTGLKRVLAEAPSLRGITLSRCGLSQLPVIHSGSVETLDLSNNLLKSVAGVETLVRLETLNVSGNVICELVDVRPLVPLGTGCLRELNLVGNPVQRVPRYRASLLELVPSLRLLDGVVVHRPWRARMNGKKHTGPSGGALSSGTSLHDSMADVANASRCQREFSASLVNATGKVDIDGYFSDDPASAEGNGCLREKSCVVRGLAGLGFIWAGAPRCRGSPMRGSSSAPTSPATTRRAPNDGITLSCTSRGLTRSNTLDGFVSRSERTAVGGRRRPLSPERYRQIQADTTRSQPRHDWDTRFRHYQQQDADARNRAMDRRARLCRGKQIATMERLAQPSRLIRPRDGEFRHTDRSPVENSIHTDGRRHNNTSGIERNSCPEGESASDRWNASFTEAIRRESQGLVDRITALKGADGKWQAAFGTCATTKRVVIRADKSVAVECPEGDSEALDNNADKVLSQPQAKGSNIRNRKEKRMQDVGSAARCRESSNESLTLSVDSSHGEHAADGLHHPGKPKGNQGVDQAVVNNRTLDSEESGLPTSPNTSPPPSVVRATLVTPDAWAVKSATIRRTKSDAILYETGLAQQAPRGSGRPQQFSRQRVLSSRTPASTLVQQGEKGRIFFAGRGKEVDTAMALSSSTSHGGREGGYGTSGFVGRGRGTSRRSRTRGFRVLKTSRDFADMMTRVYQVELEEAEARSLYQDLDSDRDGALGAEDLVRGAPALATFLAGRQQVGHAGLDRRRLDQDTVFAEDALSRSAARHRESRIREEKRGGTWRGGMDHPKRRPHERETHQLAHRQRYQSKSGYDATSSGYLAVSAYRECSLEDDTVPRAYYDDDDVRVRHDGGGTVESASVRPLSDGLVALDLTTP